MTIALNWSAELRCQKTFKNGRALIRAFALEDDFTGDLDTVTDEEAIEFVHASMENNALMEDFVTEWTFDSGIAHDVEVDLDEAEAVVVRAV